MKKILFVTLMVVALVMLALTLAIPAQAAPVSAPTRVPATPVPPYEGPTCRMLPNSYFSLEPFETGTFYGKITAQPIVEIVQTIELDRYHWYQIRDTRPDGSGMLVWVLSQRCLG